MVETLGAEASVVQWTGESDCSDENSDVCDCGFSQLVRKQAVGSEFCATKLEEVFGTTELFLAVCSFLVRHQSGEWTPSSTAVRFIRDRCNIFIGRD